MCLGDLTPWQAPVGHACQRSRPLEFIHVPSDQVQAVRQCQPDWPTWISLKLGEDALQLSPPLCIAASEYQKGSDCLENCRFFSFRPFSHALDSSLCCIFWWYISVKCQDYFKYDWHIFRVACSIVDDTFWSWQSSHEKCHFSFLSVDTHHWENGLFFQLSCYYLIFIDDGTC